MPNSTLQECNLNDLAALMACPEAPPRLLVYHLTFLFSLGMDQESIVDALFIRASNDILDKASLAQMLERSLACAERHSSK